MKTFNFPYAYILRKDSFVEIQPLKTLPVIIPKNQHRSIAKNVVVTIDNSTLYVNFSFVKLYVISDNSQSYSYKKFTKKEFDYINSIANIPTKAITQLKSGFTKKVKYYVTKGIYILKKQNSPEKLLITTNWIIGGNNENFSDK